MRTMPDEVLARPRQRPRRAARSGRRWRRWSRARARPVEADLAGRSRGRERAREPGDVQAADVGAGAASAPPPTGRRGHSALKPVAQPLEAARQRRRRRCRTTRAACLRRRVRRPRRGRRPRRRRAAGAAGSRSRAGRSSRTSTIAKKPPSGRARARAGCQPARQHHLRRRARVLARMRPTQSCGPVSAAAAASWTNVAGPAARLLQHQEHRAG